MDKNPPDDYNEQNEGPFITSPKKKKPSLFNLKALSSLRNPVFRRFYGALLAQRAALNMLMVTRSYLIYVLTGSYTLLATLNLAHILPLFFTSLIGGAFADRVQKKHILMFGQIGLFVIYIGVAISLTTGYLAADRVGSWWVLMVAAVLEGLIAGIMIPSRQAIIPEIVGERNMMNGIALTNLAMSLLRMVAPAVAGFVIDAYDYDVVYYTMAALTVIATILLISTPHIGKVVKGSVNVFANVSEGLRYIWRKKIILFILVFILMSMTLSMPIQTMMPVFTDDILKTGEKGMGILMSVSGVGAIVGSFALASLPDKKRGLMMLAGSFALGLALIVFSFSSSWTLALIMIFVFGLGQAMRMTLSSSLVMHHTEPEYRGRVMSVYTMNFSVTSLGTFAAALLSNVVGIQWALGGFAMVLVLITLLITVFAPKLYRLD
jgi:MFS family permease